MDLYEVFINEIYLQGYSIMNQIAKIYHIENINSSVDTIEVKDFNNVSFLYSTLIEHNEKSEVISQLKEIVATEKELHEGVLHLKNFLIKIFLTLERKVSLYKYR